MPGAIPPSFVHQPRPRPRLHPARRAALHRDHDRRRRQLATPSHREFGSLGPNNRRTRHRPRAVHDGRGRRRHPPQPPTGLLQVPRNPGQLRPTPGCSRFSFNKINGFSRDPANLFEQTAATSCLRNGHRPHPGQPQGTSDRSRRPFCVLRLSTPESELTPSRRYHLVRAKRQPGQPAGWTVRRRTRQPAIELPSSAIRNRSDVQRPITSPVPHKLFAMFGLGDYRHPRAAAPLPR